jgi:hypothetical protein
MRIWVSRSLIAIVTAWNLQAAAVFILAPESFARAYELSEIPGEAAVRGFGILFLMWSIPYVYAIIDPVRFRLGLVFALWMQSIGLLGESYILFTLPAEHAILSASILRFIIFDGIGLVLLSIAYLINPPSGKSKIAD